MIDLIEKIGPYLGIAAFLGLATLAVLIFQQAREIRRLREWAGRAPERAAEAVEASLAAAEARGEAGEAKAGEARGGGLRDRLADLYDGLDRRMPFDPRYLLVVVAAAVIASAVLTSGYGLVGGDDGGGNNRKAGAQKRKQQQQRVEVAVLNATQEESIAGEEIGAVEGLASRVADEVVRPAGFKVGVTDNAPNGEPETVIMYDPESKDPGEVERQADRLANRASDALGEIDVVPMVEPVRSVVKRAPIALIIGADNATF